jgi:hypothetical protein
MSAAAGSSPVEATDMKAIGVLLLAGVGYYAYTRRAQLFGGGIGGGPAPVIPLATPPGATTQIGAPPGMTPPVIASPCVYSSSQLLEKAWAWIRGNDRSQPSLLGLIRNVPKACRPGLANALKMAGVPFTTVDAAIRAVG